MSDLENPFLQVAHRIEVVGSLPMDHKETGFQTCIDKKTGEIIFLVEEGKKLSEDVRAQVIERVLWP